MQFFLKPEAPGGTASVTAGSFGRLDGAVRYRADYERGNLFVGVAGSDTDGFQDGTDRWQQSGTAGADFALTRNWTAGVQVYSSRVKAFRGSIIPLADGEPLFGIDQRDNFAIPGVYIEGDYQFYALKNRVVLGAGWTLDHLSSFSHYDRFFQGGITIVPPPAAVNKGYSETDVADRGVFHDVALTQRSRLFGWANTLTVGVNLENSWQDQASPTFTNAPNYRGPNYNTPVSNVNIDPRGIRGAVTDSRFDQRVESVYVQDRIESGSIGVTAGLRYDRFEQTLTRSNTAVESGQDGSRTSPRIGADWVFLSAPGSSHALFANYTEGFRPQAVALNTRNNVVVPDVLKPESTRSTEFGIKGRIAGDDAFYQVSVFRADKIDGQRSFRNGPDSFIFSNATSRVEGVESQIQFRLTASLSGYAHYTYQDARLRDFQTFDNAGAPTTNFAGARVRMSARHIAGVGATYAMGPWSWTTTANYVGSRLLRDNVVNPQKLPAYVLLNTAVTYRVTPALLLQGGVDNIGDEFYINDDLSSQEAGNAGAPRSFFVRARLAF